MNEKQSYTNETVTGITIADTFQPTRRNILAISALVASGALGASVPVAAKEHDENGTDMGAADIDDIDILNFARTLEFLEARFYREGLNTIGEEELRQSGPLEAVGGEMQERAYDDLRVIQEHEEIHYEVLGDTIEELGGEPVEEPAFDFGTAVEDPVEFLETAALLETTG